jgi:hypothetical protein
MRSGPGTQYGIVKILKKGDVLEVLGRNQKGTWINVRTRAGEEGWVALSVVTFSGSIDDLEVAAAPPPPSQGGDQGGGNPGAEGRDSAGRPARITPSSTPTASRAYTPPCGSPIPAGAVLRVQLRHRAVECSCDTCACDTVCLASARRTTGIRTNVSVGVESQAYLWRADMQNISPRSTQASLFTLWVLVNIVGWSASHAILRLPHLQTAREILPLIMAFVLDGMMVGVIIGAGQWLILKQTFPKLSGWIQITALTYAIGLLVSLPAEISGFTEWVRPWDCQCWPRMPPLRCAISTTYVGHDRAIVGVVQWRKLRSYLAPTRMRRCG